MTVAGQTMTTTVGADGTWSVTPTIPLPPGASHSCRDDHGCRRQPRHRNPGHQRDGCSSESSAPDFSSVGPSRVFDTRPGQSPLALRVVAKQQVGGGYELQVQMTDLVELSSQRRVSGLSR